MTEEPQEQPSKLAGGCVLTIAAGAAAAVAYAVPETGYFVAGLLTAATVRKARAWTAGRRHDDNLEQPLLTPGDVIAAMHQLAAPHVHLALLAEELDTTTQDLRTVLEEMGVPVAGGVRMKGAGVSTGVRAADIPPLSPAASRLREPALTSNNNSNNIPESGPREGFRVEPIGQAGAVVHDPAEAHRHQTVGR